MTEQVLAAPEPSLEIDDIPNRPRRQATTVNFLAVYDNCWLALYYMRLPSKFGPANAQKSLIFTGSTMSYMDLPGDTDYNAAKCKFPLPWVAAVSGSWCRQDW